MIVFFQFEIVNDNLIKYRYYSHKLDEELQKTFQEHIYFYNLSSSKFILLLRKGVILMDIWMIEKSLMKEHYLQENKSFIAT